MSMLEPVYEKNFWKDIKADIIRYDAARGIDPEKEDFMRGGDEINKLISGKISNGIRIDSSAWDYEAKGEDILHDINFLNLKGRLGDRYKFRIDYATYDRLSPRVSVEYQSAMDRDGKTSLFWALSGEYGKSFGAYPRMENFDIDRVRGFNVSNLDSLGAIFGSYYDFTLHPNEVMFDSDSEEGGNTTLVKFTGRNRKAYGNLMRKVEEFLPSHGGV
ncbi:MAG: hypothetical protein HY833_02545 [Candidatus Aenigmarchaeota archaeon]|nr:hypothetical protein [Candidatus Aenigmarchaeota archaeon]